MMLFYLLRLGLFLGCWVGFSVAQADLLTKNMSSLSALQNISILEDKRGDMGFEQASRPENAALYKPWPVDQGQINMGFTQSAYWVRVGLRRDVNAPANWVLEVPFFLLNQVDFYAPQRPVVRTGGERPLTSRPFLHRFFAFPIEVDTQNHYYYLRVSSHHSVTVPITMWQEQAFRHHVQNTTLLQALYFGGLLALLIYNLFLGLSLKDLRFLLYSMFIAVFGLGMLSGNGMGQMFFWPGQPWFDSIAQTFFICLSGAFVMLFANQFLQARRYLPKSSTLLLTFALLFLINACMLVVAPWLGFPTLWAVQMLYFLALPASLMVLIAGYRVLKLGHKGARFFLLAWAVLWSGAIIATLRAFEFIPTNVWTSYSLQLSSAVEMLLLAFALADIVHLERQERERAQREALQANQQLLQRSQSAQEQLEGEVQKRTQELQQALVTQTQFLDKYLRFGALISHEFRNPLGIVNSQISLLRKEYSAGQLTMDKRLDTMASATQRLLSLFETWLHGDRLQHDMKSFFPQHIPLAAWLRELVDAQSVYHEKNPLSLQLLAPVGDVWVDENLLEVAMLNLIDNACKYSEPGQAVVIETRKKPGWVGMAVIDQGCGIDIKDHQLIFEDYQRVSAESSIAGLGLGLAFVRRIVEKHRGQLELESALGVGSTFCLWLPEK
jgi:signal transduction histidine kinase